MKKGPPERRPRNRQRLLPIALHCIAGQSAASVAGFGFFTNDKAAIAVGAFDPAFVMRNRQPDAGMAQGTDAAVAGDAIRIYNLGLGRRKCHVSAYQSCRGPLGPS